MGAEIVEVFADPAGDVVADHPRRRPDQRGLRIRGPDNVAGMNPPTRFRVAPPGAGAGAGADPAHGRLRVTGVTLRGQDAQPGDLFAALPGATSHGARYAADAVERGAVAILTDPDGAAQLADPAVPLLVHPDPRSVLGDVSATVYGRPSDQLRVIGVTGTSGKTTTTYLVEAGLRAAGRVAGEVELLPFLHEQAVSVTAHRFGTPDHLTDAIL